MINKINKYLIYTLMLFVIYLTPSIEIFSDEGVAKKRFRIDSVIAVVNDEVITMTDLQRSLIPLIKQLKSNFTGDELMRKIIDAEEAVLTQLVENKLILQTAVSLKDSEELKISEKEILKYVQGIIDRFPSRDIFKETLKRENLSYEDFRQDCIDQLLVKKLVSMKVSSKVFVSNEDVKEYYKANIDDYITSAKVTFSQIWLKKDPKDNAKKELIEKLQTEIKNGADFKAMAVQHSEGPHASEGGIWKNVEKGQFTPELEGAIWSLSPGQISDIIETRVSYHLVKIEVIEKPREIPLEELWNKIQNKIYFQQAEALRKEWIEELREKAFIQINYEKK